MIEMNKCVKAGDTKNVRGNWGRQIEFLLALIGNSVGLGNIWRFPYLCMRNGGGAFLVPYFIFLMICGLPLTFLELSLGQFSNLSPLSMWSICPLFKGVGFGMLVVSAIVAIYYNTILAWVLYYLGMSFSKEVPWKGCNNVWNTPDCLTELPENNYSSGYNPYSMVNNTMSLQVNISQHNDTLLHTGRRSSAEEFWTYKVLDVTDDISDLGTIKWDLLLCLAAAWILVLLCLINGIKTSGKVVYVTATVPYVFLTILLVRGVTLPGSLDGIKFYIIPDWQQLTDFNIWTDACLQVFYSLGPAWGGVITMASYNRFNNNCLRDSLVVTAVCGATSFYSGFVIFAAIGFMAHSAGLPIEDVITQGPGLAFSAYPEAISRLPVSPFWAICFFLMLLTIGLDTQFVMVETVVTGIVDGYPQYFRKRKMMLLIILILVFFLLGLPMVTKGGMYVFLIFDWYSASFSLTLIALAECLAVCYIYGIGRFYSDINMMIQRNLSIVWAVCWCFITPLMVIIMIVVLCIRMAPPTYGSYVFPWWAEMLGWVIALLSVIPIPGVAVWKLLSTRGSINKRFAILLQPDSDWQPASEQYKTDYKYNLRHHTWRERMTISRDTWGVRDNGKPERVSLKTTEKTVV